MMTKKELISTIKIDKANLLNIASTGNINGSLLISMEKIMDDYAKVKMEEHLKWLIEVSQTKVWPK